MDQELTTEELQYIFWEYERQLQSNGWLEQRFQDDRHVSSLTDAIQHARWMAHNAQFEQNRDALLSSLGLFRGILWSWGDDDLCSVDERDG